MNPSLIDRCCCTCDRNKRINDESGHISCECEIDGHYISYLDVFEQSCRHYALDKEYELGGEWYHELPQQLE